MIKTFTPNDVVRFLYKETSQTENREVENALLCNTDLLDQYVQLEAIKGLMDRIRMTPKKVTLQAILDYSSSYNPILSS